MTKTPLTLDDLLPIKVNTTVKPKPAGATSIPGMLAVFHNEWDALHETHELAKISTPPDRSSPTPSTSTTPPAASSRVS